MGNGDLNNNNNNTWRAAEVLLCILTLIVLVGFFVHIICRDYKILNEKKMDQERISRIFHNLVTRKVKNAERENLTFVDKLQLIAFANGACEAFQRLYNGSDPGLAEILSESGNNEGIALETISSILGQHEDFLRAHLLPM